MGLELHDSRTWVRDPVLAPHRQLDPRSRRLNARQSQTRFAKEAAKQAMSRQSAFALILVSLHLACGRSVAAQDSAPRALPDTARGCKAIAAATLARARALVRRPSQVDLVAATATYDTAMEALVT